MYLLHIYIYIFWSLVLKPSLYTALLIIQCISRTMLFQDTQIGYNRLRITFRAFMIHTEKKSSLIRKPSPFTSKRKGNYERTDQDLGSLLQFAGAHPIRWFSLSYISILSSNIMSPMIFKFPSPTSEPFKIPKHTLPCLETIR